MTDKAELKKRISESSARVLLVGDIHLMDKPPRNATETYLDDILEILKFTAQLEQALEIDAVIWAGDVFHHKMPSRTSHRLVLKTIEAVKRYQNLWIVTGNHDISNDRLETVAEQQPLGVLFEAGAHELNGWLPGLPVFGIPWQQRWLEEGTLRSCFEEYRAGPELHLKEKYQPEQVLVVTHAPISPHQNEMYEVLSNIEIAAAMGNAGSLYYGHIHDDHGIWECDGVTFCNVGAISRGSATESNATRSIKAALWTPEHGFLEIDLPHRPAGEVLKLEEVKKSKEEKISLEGFLADVGTTRIDISSTAAVISHIQQLEIAEPVKKISIELLEAQDA